MSSPGGRYAFFDLDGTLINDTSLLSWYDFYVRQTGSDTLLDAWVTSREALARMRDQGRPREEQNVWFYQRHFKGMPVRDAQQAAASWVAFKAKELGFFKQPLVARLFQHRWQGTEVVLVTGSFLEVARCVGERLGVAHYLCAQLAVDDGVYTGELTDSPMIGEGKAFAVARFLAAEGACARDCYGYGDDSSDLPFLMLLGRPNAVSGGCQRLLQCAADWHWGVC